MLGVQQWAEVRRLVLVEGLSQRQVARRLGLARATVAKAVASEMPPKYSRTLAGSKLDPFKDWICEQRRHDPRFPAQRPAWGRLAEQSASHPSTSRLGGSDALASRRYASVPVSSRRWRSAVASERECSEATGVSGRSSPTLPGASGACDLWRRRRGRRVVEAAVAAVILFVRGG